MTSTLNVPTFNKIALKASLQRVCTKSVQDHRSLSGLISEQVIVTVIVSMALFCEKSFTAPKCWGGSYIAYSEFKIMRGKVHKHIGIPQRSESYPITIRHLNHLQT